MQTSIDIFIRSVLLFFLTFIIIRLMGKRNLVRIAPFRFVSYLVIAIIVALMSANIITNPAFGLIVLGVWFVFPLVIDYAGIRSKAVHDLVHGKETILVKHGKIMEESMLQVKLTGEELLRELRSKNAFNLADVEFAVLESTGDINVYMKSDKKPVTAHDLGMKVAPLTEPQTVILDGNILNESLSSLGVNKEWLGIQMENMGVSLDNVFIGQVDSSGDLYLDLFDDGVQLPQPKVKELLYANLEKTHADLLGFALETEDEEAKVMYNKNAKSLEVVLRKLKPYLLR